MAASSPPPATPPSTPPGLAAKVFPRSTWRKKPSEKGKTRLKLDWRWKTRTPKPPPSSKKKKPPSSSKKKKREAPVRKKNKREAAGDGVGERPPPLVRRKLDLDGEAASKTSSRLGCFHRAKLMDNLRSLAKLDNVDEPLASPPPPPKIVRLPFGRAQLMDNLRSLAKLNNLNLLLQFPAVDTSSFTADERQATTKKARPRTRMVDKLQLVPYNSKRAAAAADEGPISSMALVVQDMLAGTQRPYVLRWISHAVAIPSAKTVRSLVPISPTIEAAYNELMRLEETSLGENLDDIPGGPELEKERRRIELLVDQFMEPVRRIIGKREFCNWKGSVVTSVVGTFLTQNVRDNLSSNAFMNLAAKFSTNNESNIGESTDVTLVTNGCGLGVSKPNKKRTNNKGIEELIASLRTGEMSNWDKKRIDNVLQGRFQKSTANRISMDIANFLNKDTSSHWKYLHEEAYKNGYRNEETNETIDWEALLHAPYSEFEECIKDRGTYRQLVFRILLFLIRTKRDHGSIDLEWLRYVPRAEAKKYLNSIIGIGDKSVDCIRLLSLRHRAFPVDTNVARIVTRLGWVPLQPLDGFLEFHMVDKNPVMASIQKYLEPLLCRIPAHKVYELHCQQITFGKSICTKQRPNCGACPFTNDCKYYKSLFGRAKLALPEYSQQDERGQANMDERIQHILIGRPSHEHMHQYQIEMGKGTERHSTEVTIEIPPTPPHEYPESSNEEEYEEECQDIIDIEDIGAYYDDEIDLRTIKPTENATTGLAHGTDMVLIHPRTNPIPMQMKHRLRTEYHAYIIPDGHEILHEFEPRVHGDCNPYLLIIRDQDDQNVNATILIPCRTANRGIFPLDGTYFQINEVFADHLSSRSPIQIRREIVYYFERCIVYFGSSIHVITRGQTLEKIQQLYRSGYICSREFDRRTRRTVVLSPEMHATAIHKTTGKKRRMPDDSSPSSGEGSGKDIDQRS